MPEWKKIAERSEAFGTDGYKSYGFLQNQMLVLANVIAILGCMCILERIFGTETLRPFIEMAKKEAGDLENATRH